MSRGHFTANLRAATVGRITTASEQRETTSHATVPRPSRNAAGDRGRRAGLVGATEPDAVLNLARGYGSALLEKDSVGDPMIRSRIDGKPYLILFYDCTGNADCRSIQLQATWNMAGVTVDELNAWNRDQRFGMAYLDGDNDPTLEMNINLDFGVAPRNLDDTFGWWQSALTDFQAYLASVGDAEKAPAPEAEVDGAVVAEPDNDTAADPTTGGSPGALPLPLTGPGKDGSSEAPAPGPVPSGGTRNDDRSSPLHPASDLPLLRSPLLLPFDGPSRPENATR